MQIRPPSALENKPSLDPAALERSPALDLSWPHSAISPEHRPLTMELVLTWIFFVAIFKGDL
jgi:hypothetical protein